MPVPLGAAVVVGSDETLEAEITLQHSGDHRSVLVHAHPLPAAVRGHDRSDASTDSGLVRRQVERAQRGLVARGVA